MPDIFDEVEEDLRADRAQALLKRYGGMLVAAAVLVVAGAGAWRAWEWRENKRIAAVADTYLAAAQTADALKGPAREAAAAQFAAVAAKAPGGYRTLAQLREAGLKAQAGDLAGASALWDQVSGDGGADPLLRDVASLQWAMHHVDSGDPAQVAARLGPLAAARQPVPSAGGGNPGHARPAPGQDRGGARHADRAGAGRDGAERGAPAGARDCWRGSAPDHDRAQRCA